MRPSGERGMTLLELVLSLAIIATISLAMAVMFKLALTANLYCGNETTLLSNIRKAFQGDGQTRGMLFDALYASSTTATGSTSLSLRLPGQNAATTYTLSSTNLQRSTGTATTLATGLANLEFAYYAYYSTGSIKQTAAAADARLITISFQTSLSKGTTFYAGAVPRNHL